MFYGPTASTPKESGRLAPERSCRLKKGTHRAEAVRGSPVPHGPEHTRASSNLVLLQGTRGAAETSFQVPRPARVIPSQPGRCPCLPLVPAGLRKTLRERVGGRHVPWVVGTLVQGGPVPPLVRPLPRQLGPSHAGSAPPPPSPLTPDTRSSRGHLKKWVPATHLPGWR